MALLCTNPFNTNVAVTLSRSKRYKTENRQG
jgi:hypothetical protein